MTSGAGRMGKVGSGSLLHFGYCSSKKGNSK